MPFFKFLLLKSCPLGEGGYNSMENISLTGKAIMKRTTETGWGGVRGRDGRRKEDSVREA